MMQFRQEAPQPQRALPEPPFHFWETQGDVTAEFRRNANGFLLRFVGRADFTVDLTDAIVTCVPAPGVPASLIAALRYNQVEPLLLNHAGKLVLHAAAIVSGGRALAFAGASGRGKSTLAAAFARHGHPFLTDDGLLLEPVADGYLAVPSLDSVRLRIDSEAALFARSPAATPDDRGGKSLVPAGLTLPHQPRPVPLEALYFLGEGACEGAAFARLAQAEALLALTRHAFILDVDDRERVRANFERLAQLSQTVPVFTLDYPRRYDGLPGLIRAIVDHADQGATTR